MSEEIRDELGNKIEVGSRVVYGIPTPEELSNCLCTVYEITEVDADYDDELGRAVAYGPCVKIRFDTGEEDQIQASFDFHESDHYEHVYTVADIELYTPGLTETLNEAENG